MSCREPMEEYVSTEPKTIFYFRGIRMSHERTRKKNKQKASELNLAVILLFIVFMFFVCHFPRILLNVHEFFMLEDMIQCGSSKYLY